MNFNDNSSALYVDPNAYVQNCKPKRDRKKIVFQQPYENMANFYIDNNFKRGDCSCKEGKCKECCDKPNNPPCDCESDNCKQNNNCGGSNPFSLPFDIKNLLPLLGGLGGGGLSNIISSLGSGNSGANNATNTANNGGIGGILNNLSQNGGLAELISRFSQNSGGIGGLLNLFKKQAPANKINSPKSSDICIKDYQRVE